ncbi:MAG: MacS family sensor histidine kinase [Nocardioidaceae bacterium]
MAAGAPEPGAALRQVDTSLFRALAVLRVVVLVYAVVVNVDRWREFAHPAAGWAVNLGMVAWTVLIIVVYAAPARRRTPWFVADVLVALAAILLTPYVEGVALVARHAPSLPTYWVMVPVLVWAVRGGWGAGLVAGVVVSAADLSIRSGFTPSTYGNVFLLVVGGAIVGYMTSLLREQTEARAQAERSAAAMEERARLARAVHDGVLQVLALVQRRGTELGGEAAELGRLAGEQEVALRSLVQGARRPEPTGADLDLLPALATVESRSVTLSGPGRPVLLPAHTVRELAAVVGTCLDNVARHVGPDAPAWVLVEELDGSVVVTVRDEGPGIADGRLEQAQAEGRLGVCASIRGRIADLGGTAELVTAPGRGTEWELSVPRR